MGSYASGRKKQNRSPVLAIYNNHLPTIEYCQTITGIGSITVKRHRKNPNFVWGVKSQRNIVALLKQLLPYLITKKEKANSFLRDWQDLPIPQQLVN